MNGSSLLDTNAVIGLFARDPAVEERVGGEEEVFVPSVVLGELYFGAYRSRRVSANLHRIDELAASHVVLACDATTARQYGTIRNDLREKGRPIPENDIWIADIAIQHDLTLISEDLHFAGVEGLKVEDWQ